MLIHQSSPGAIRYDQKLRSRAKQLRVQETPAETLLWKSLKGKKLGYKFRRQHPLHGFIVDFYCYELMLVIEVDGSVHEHQEARDQLRDLKLKQHGYTTLRFSNEEVLFHLPEVLNKILNVSLFPA